MLVPDSTAAPASSRGGVGRVFGCFLPPVGNVARAQETVLPECAPSGDPARGSASPAGVAVFELRRRPWIEPDAAEADSVAEVVQRCPSGALQFRRLDGGPDELPPLLTEVSPLRKGPLLGRGRVEVTRDALEVT